MSSVSPSNKIPSKAAETEIRQDAQSLESNPSEVLPTERGPSEYKNLTTTEEEENAFDIKKGRTSHQQNGLLVSICYMVKAALAGSLFSGHVAYMKGGIYVSILFNLLFGIYIGHCIYTLVTCAHILYRRTRSPVMTYPDVAEAAVACFPNPKIAKYSKVLRHAIAAFICIELFGSCLIYQLIMAKTLKQLVEETEHVKLDGFAPGYPDLRVYMALLIIPIILICLIQHFKWLAPFTMVANIILFCCIIMTVYYAFQYNPKFENLVRATTLYGFFEFMGMNVFTMSCAAVIPIENHMKDPEKYVTLVCTGMTIIVSFTFMMSFFGYAAFLDQCEAPITLNYPMNIWTKVVKGGIAIMIYFTHALNFWIPFRILFYYISPFHKNRLFWWEMFYRALFVLILSATAIAFPNIDSLMALLGSVSTSNMGFIWPNVIFLLVVWDRPGLGKFKWRLWKSMICIVVGIVLLLAATVVNTNELITKIYS